MAKAMQNAPVKGAAISNAKALPKSATVEFDLKGAGKLRFVQINTPAMVADRGAMEKLVDVKSSLGKLLEMIVSSTLPSDTLDAMLDEVTKSASRRQPRGGALTKNHVDVLTRSGALTPQRLLYLEKRVNAGELAQLERETRLGAIVRTLTAEEVGERLGGISASRVRHRQNDNLLYAFLSGKSRRYPLWQFVDDDRVLPGLADIIPHFIEGWQPASIEGFMTTPQEELSSGFDDDGLTPVEWLAGGGDPQAVVAIFDRIARA